MTTNIDEELNERILGCAIRVHRELGPGLLESAYRECLRFELYQAGLCVRAEVPLGVTYRESRIECGYRADIVVEDRVLLELKTVDRILPIHEAQLLTYLRFSGIEVGFLLNFNAMSLRKGIRRMLLSKPRTPAEIERLSSP